ncbi:MAG: hypothetical protein R8K48_00850 [Gallionella sp.]
MRCKLLFQWVAHRCVQRQSVDTQRPSEFWRGGDEASDHTACSDVCGVRGRVAGSRWLAPYRFLPDSVLALRHKFVRHDDGHRVDCLGGGYAVDHPWLAGCLLY